MKHYSLFLIVLMAVLNVAVDKVRSQSEDTAAADSGEEEPSGTIDEIIVNAANSSREFDFFYDENTRLLKMEFDMVIPFDDWADIERADGRAARKKRTAGIIAGRGGAQRWTNNVVNYQLAPHFTSQNIRVINSAIADWERFTCLDFRQSSSGNRIYMKNGGGCYSRVGMVGGAQDLGLAPGCRHKGVVIHEIGHALGLHHEQTRPDRDEHVRIIRRNIPSRIYYNFQKSTWNTIKNMGIPYDYTSIMHYGKTAFSSNGQLTIQTIDPKYQDVIGNRHGLSFGDIKSINLMYNCKRHTRGCTKTDASCPGTGFVGKDCTCVCSGGSLRNPVRSCSGTGGGGGATTPRPVTSRPVTPRPTTRPTGGCQDQHRSCTSWAGRGECTANPAYMFVFCKRSCGKCGGGGTRAVCNDLHFNCPTWRMHGYCNNGRYRSYMSTNCKRSCGKCGRSNGYRTDTGCTDSNDYCASWARIGECQRNPDYMLQSCKQSCGQCNQASPGLSANPNAYCSDRSPHCSFWAGTGACDNNAGYMTFMCKSSCGLC